MATIDTLKTQIQETVKDIPTTFGVAVRVLESGEEVLLNNHRAYQLASVFKIPVLVTAMQQVDAGRFKLDDRIPLKESDKTSPSGILCYLRSGLQPTVADLLMLMIIISDNTATDMVLDLVGGPEAVNASMRALGLGEEEINITKSVHGLFEDVFGTSAVALKRGDSIRMIREHGIHLEAEVYRPGSRVNVATPRVLNRLNEMIFCGQAASRESCAEALEILLHQTLNARLPGLLPPDDAEAEVAHKTGTFIGVRNDSGIFYLGNGKHIAVTVFTQKEQLPSPEEMMKVDTAAEDGQIDAAIAKIGKLVYDYGMGLA
jgi:beta-lactamase class A